MEKPLTDFNPNARQQSIADLIFGSPLEQAQSQRDASFQNWLNQRRASVEKQRTDDIKMAKYNALGNALTTMVQPIGWAIGGSTGDVQPYDNRQYLEAFNRAVKASDDLRNIGDMEAEYQFKLADEDYRRQLALEDRQRQRAESLEDYFKRLDYQQKIGAASNEKDLFQARRTAAVKAYYDLMRSDSIHKSGLPSFYDFINMGGYGKDYYGDWKPSEEEIRMDGWSGKPASTTAANDSTVTGASQSGTSSSTNSTKQNPAQAPAASAGALTADEKRLVEKWAKYDTNNNGQLDKEEIAVYNSNRKQGDARVGWYMFGDNKLGKINKALKKNKKLNGTSSTTNSSGNNALSILNQ